MITETWTWIRESFWSESVWLPPNTTWTQLAPGPDKSVVYNDHTDLLLPLPMAFIMLFIRFILDRYWFNPLGIALGIKNSRPKKAAPNPVLETVYKKGGKLKHKNIVALAKQLDITERQVERWLRQRHSQDKPSTLTKFCENFWRCVYYTCSFTMGAVVLWDKPWLWNIDHCYLGYPHQGITNDIWWYYMINLSFYWSLMMSQFFDVKRKDFWQMFIHHICTISLMAFSWVCNLHRIGTLVLLCHDCVDIFLEAAKMTKYANYQKLCDCIFGLFTVLWFVTRLGIYPFYIIWSTSIRAPKLLPMFPAYYIFNSLLILLLFLHIIWSYLILQIVYKAVAAGKMDGDVRSSTSEVSDSSTNNDKHSNNSNNHSNNHKSSPSASNSQNNTPKKSRPKKE